MPRIQTCRGPPEVRPNCMAATQWHYSPVSTKVSGKVGILEIACYEMRNLVPPVRTGEERRRLSDVRQLPERLRDRYSDRVRERESPLIEQAAALSGAAIS